MIGLTCSNCGKWRGTEGAHGCQCTAPRVESEHPTIYRTHDPVNHPDRYTQGGIETIDIMRAKLSPEEFAGYCRGNVIKYITRAPHKGGVEDLQKAQWYLARLIEETAR